MNSVETDTAIAATRGSGSAAEHRAPAAPAVRLVGVRRTYAVKRGRTRGTIVALDGVGLEIPSGQRVALLGPNGSGKSTLLRILATLDRPDQGAGEVELLGERLTASAVRGVRVRLGVVFQTPGLDGLLTIEENLAAAGALYGLGGAGLRERIDWAAARLSLRDRLHDRVRTLSGGLARRADLARALLHDPDLLLLDEPTTGLDPRARDEFLATVDAVASEARPAGRPPMTVVMSTHLMEEAQRTERVVLLHRGRIIADATPDDLRRRVGAGGGQIIRCHAGARPEVVEGATRVLTAAGLVVDAPGRSDGRADVVIARVPEGAEAKLEPALVGLMRAGVPFEVGPPTLGDVFLALTGEALEPREAPEPTPRHRQRRHAG